MYVITIHVWKTRLFQPLAKRTKAAVRKGRPSQLWWTLIILYSKEKKSCHSNNSNSLPPPPPLLTLLHSAATNGIGYLLCRDKSCQTDASYGCLQPSHCACTTRVKCWVSLQNGCIIWNSNIPSVYYCTAVFKFLWNNHCLPALWAVRSIQPAVQGARPPSVCSYTNYNNPAEAFCC